jgi:hypothetical protein
MALRMAGVWHIDPKPAQLRPVVPTPVAKGQQNAKPPVCTDGSVLSGDDGQGRHSRARIAFTIDVDDTLGARGTMVG